MSPRFNREEAMRKFEQKIAEDKAKIAVLMQEDFLDEDGYPTESALEIIKLWPYDDLTGWFKFIEDIWYMKSWGWHEIDTVDNIYGNVHEYHISTAGWSGSESIIGAMQQNWTLWSISWVQSRRGGHYIFQTRKDDEDESI